MLDYAGTLTTPTATITTATCLFNSVVSTPKAKCVLADIYIFTGVLQEFCHLIKGPEKEIWKESLANEFGRLAQGVRNRIEGTNTMYFIPKEEVPLKTKKLTYPKIVCDIRPNKAETH